MSLLQNTDKIQIKFANPILKILCCQLFLERRHYINETARLSTPQKSLSLIGQINSCARDSKACERLSKSCARVRISCARVSISWARETISCARDKMFHLHVPLGAPYNIEIYHPQSSKYNYLLALADLDAALLLNDVIV